MPGRGVRVTEAVRAIRRRPPRAVLLVIVLMLLAAGAYGIATRSQVTLDSSSLVPSIPALEEQDAPLSRIVISAFLLAGLFLIRVMSGSWRVWFVWMLGMLGVLMMFLLLSDPLRDTASPSDEPEGEPTPIGQSGGEGAQVSWSWQVTAAIAVVVAILGAVIFLLLRRPSAIGTGRPGFDAELARQASSAIARGRSALQDSTDTRSAVIACYVAMETALSEQGVKRRLADTPTELLHRARTAGLLGPAGLPAAARLSELFHQARFSSDALPESARDEAESALARLGAEFETIAARGGTPRGSARR